MMHDIKLSRRGFVALSAGLTLGLWPLAALADTLDDIKKQGVLTVGHRRHGQQALDLEERGWNPSRHGIRDASVHHQEAGIA